MNVDPLFVALPSWAGDNKQKRALCSDKRLRRRFVALSLLMPEKNAATVALRLVYGIGRSQ